MQPAVNDSQLPAPGTVLAGKYEIIRIIGEGGMGVVYEAKHVRLNHRVALKLLRPSALHLDAITPRFDREARAAAHLRGRHVARIFDVDVSEGGLPFMVMEYLVGRDLDAELAERGNLSVQEATGYVLQACAAMREAHAAGIVHRDLKPANLFIIDEGGERIVKVLDFGISKITHEVDTHLTGTFATVGTPLYMSPEQVRSSKDVDARTDIWSLAVILFEALAGKPPFTGSMTATAAAIVADPTPSLCAIRPDVPRELEVVLERALAKSPSKRFPDVEALVNALAPFGPPRLPFSSLGEISNPILPPSSGPTLSGKLVPIAPISRPSATPTIADTMLLPRSEEAKRRAIVRRRRQLAALAMALIAGGAIFRHVTAKAPMQPAPSAIARATPPPLATVPALPPVVPAPSAVTSARPPVSVPSATASPYARPTASARSAPAAARSQPPTPPPKPSANPAFL